MRRSRSRTALLAAAALGAASLVLLAPAPGHPSIAVADTTVATGTAGLFVPANGRLLDTRNGTGGYATPMPANTVRTVAAAGVAGIPLGGVSALALTLAVVGAGTVGAISVAPGDVATPTGTALVFNPGDSVSNTDLVALHADGQLHVVSNATVNLIIDVQGYFTAGSATAPGGFVPVDQARIVDTRNGTNVPQAMVATGGAVTVTAAGLAGVPSDASAVYVNIAVLGQTHNGYLRTYAAGGAVPTTGALDFDDTTQAVSTAIPLSADGAFTVLVGAGGPVDLIVDIQGYFTPRDTAGAFTPAAVHLLDTRVAPVRTIAGNGVLSLPVAGVAGIPTVGDGVAAVALNLRTVQPSTGSAAGGYLRVWASDQPEPTTSSLNYTTANIYRTDLVIAAPAADGTVTIHNGGPAPIDLVVDVEGWFLTTPPPAPITFSYQYPEGTTVPPSASAVFDISTPTAPPFPVSSFAWSLDGGPATTVNAQLDQDVVLARLTLPSDLGSSDGPHSLQLVTIDKQGRRSPATSYSWTTQVGAPSPETVPADPTVSSSTYPENRWSPATGTAEFVINDSGQQPPVTSLSYALDDADPTTVSGDSLDLTVPSPSSDGLHVLHVSATSTVGESGYDYAFYLGTTPTAVSAVAATAGQGSVLLSWPAATGPVSGYDVQLVDNTGQAADIGTCEGCTSMAVSGLPAGQVLAARVSATAPAGPSPATSSGVFTVGNSGTAATCSATTCQSVDASCSLTTCDTSTTSGDAVYAMHYIDMDGSSAVVAEGDSAAHLVSRAADGTAGNAGIMAASGALSISVTTGVPAQLDGSGSTTPAQPDAKTPRGYHLLGNNVLDPFHYRSDRAAVVVDKTINRRKYLIGETTTQMRESLYGSYSNRWVIGVQAAYVAGEPYDFYYLYTCGINVPKTEDWTCNTHENDADGVYDEYVVYNAVWNTYEQHNASFGSSETRYAKFPMVDWRVSYHDAGATVSNEVRYRGWDIRYQNRTWVMSPVSGTGF
jgi:hypothetical protein